MRSHLNSRSISLSWTWVWIIHLHYVVCVSTARNGWPWRVSSGHGAPAVLHRRLWPKNRTGQETTGRNAGGDQRWGGGQGKELTVRSAGNPWTPLSSAFHFQIIFILEFHTPAFCSQTSKWWIMVHSSDINSSMCLVSTSSFNGKYLQIEKLFCLKGPYVMDACFHRWIKKVIAQFWLAVLTFISHNSKFMS